MTLDELQAAMDAAAAALDFEAAGRLRDRISIVRAGGDDPGDALAGLARQQPGSMGIGTSQQRVVPPAGWVKPKKPDPMTTGRKR